MYSDFKMKDQNIHFRHLMLFYFRKGKSGAKTVQKICSVYGHDVVALTTVCNWFRRFKSGNFDLDDQKRSGRPTVNVDAIKSIIDQDCHSTTRSIAEKVNISHITVGRHLKSLNYVNRYDVWIPHQLTEKNVMRRIEVCNSLLLRNLEDPFLKRTITGDEKWIVFDNPKRKRSWQKRNEAPKTIAKAGLHSKKVMLCIWWDWQGVIYYELLPQGQTLNSIKYCSQLDQLKDAIDEKRPSLANRKGIVFQQDNARPHVSLMTHQKIVELGWEQLSHPAYSPDLAPSDYHLFRSLQNSLSGKKFENLEACQKHLDQFIAQKDDQFWKDGMMKLPERWLKVVQQNGAYLTD